MSNPSVAVPESKNASPKVIRTLPDYDDDDDDADYDDDDDESVAAGPHEPWFAHSGFGSLDWWSRL